MIDHKTSVKNSEPYEGEFIQHYRVDYIKAICRELRKSQTDTEEMLWKALRNRKLEGLKFLRQHPFGRSIVDFYCHDKRLVIEIDGGIHNNADVKEYDKLRQELIENYGVRFYRCTSEQVERDLEGVLFGILRAAFGNSPPTPSLGKRGGAEGGGELGGQAW